MSDALPYSLAFLAGIHKERLLNLRRRQLLGLNQSADEPIRSTFSQKVVALDELLERLNLQARRELGSALAPTEAKWL